MNEMVKLPQDSPILSSSAMFLFRWSNQKNESVYFAKLDDYTQKKANFSNFVSEEPRVLVVDNVEDPKSFSMDSYRSYRLRQVSREDLVYKRYTASWSQEISSILNGNQDLIN